MQNKNGHAEESLSLYFSNLRRLGQSGGNQGSIHARSRNDSGPVVLEELVTANLTFVVSVAKRYRGRGLPFEDLVNEGNLGLIEAARRYDPARGVRFITYAVWWIRKAMLRAIEYQAKVVRVPNYQVRRITRRADAARANPSRPPFGPTRNDPVGRLLAEAATAGKAPRLRVSVVSLDDSASCDSKRTFGDSLVNVGEPSPEETVVRQDYCERVLGAFGRLPSQDRIVLAHRFGLTGRNPLTLRKTAAKMGLSGERVRQIERDALERLRRILQSSHPALSRGAIRRAVTPAVTARRISNLRP